MEYINMNKTLGIALTTAALLFGGAGVAHATTPSAPLHSSTTSTLAADNDGDDGDNNGLWGLAGLLGLIGLAGLKRRNEHQVAAPPVVPGPGTTPRA
jgi:hypothetical protein